MRLLLCLLLMLPANAFADSITLRLIASHGGAPQHVLDAVLVLEPSSGPFWDPIFGYVNNRNGYLVASLTGTFNGIPVTLAPFDSPLRPDWVEWTNNILFPNNIHWTGVNASGVIFHSGL